MRSLLLCLAAVAAAMFAEAAARADFTYEFDNTSGTPTSYFTANPGSTVTIAVYLVETDTNGTLQSQGLQSAGVNVVSDTPAVAAVNSASDINANPGFMNQNNSVSGGAATLQADNFGNASIVYPASGDPNRILLGTFTFTAGSVGYANLTAENIDQSGEFDYNVTGSGEGLDGLISPATATIAVPEPSPLYLTGLAVPLIGAGAWLRLRRRSPMAAA